MPDQPAGQRLFRTAPGRLLHRLLLRSGARLPGRALAGLIGETARQEWPLLAPICFAA